MKYFLHQGIVLKSMCIVVLCMLNLNIPFVHGQLPHLGTISQRGTFLQHCHMHRGTVQSTTKSPFNITSMGPLPQTALALCSKDYSSLDPDNLMPLYQAEVLQSIWQTFDCHDIQCSVTACMLNRLGPHQRCRGDTSKNCGTLPKLILIHD